MKKLFTIAGTDIYPDSTTTLEIPVANLATGTDISIPVHIVAGKKPGPVVFISAAIHGDELNGIEIIRRLITHKRLTIKQGVVIYVPMVNIYGVVSQSRYMPDRRDLNRFFPGSPKGSLAGRVAYTFLNEIVSLCDYGIDLHTGAIHRSNFPQIRADLDDEETRRLAESFGVPILLNSVLRDGSLRQAAVENGTKILLYEAGEALRFDELSIAAGVNGVINVLKALNMTRIRAKKIKVEPFTAYKSYWCRAEESGILNWAHQLGDRVEAGEVLATLNSPLGHKLSTIVASKPGIIIGQTNIPLVQEGEAVFHIAIFGKVNDEVAEHVELLQDAYVPETTIGSESV